MSERWITGAQLVRELLDAIAADARGEAVLDVDLFDEGISPLKIAFWHAAVPQLGETRADVEWAAPHYEALRAACATDSMSQDEMTALAYEWRLICAGRRDFMGRPCVCEDGGIKWPAAIRGGGGSGGDSRLGPIGLIADLERAADTLPIPWESTRRIFAAQGRTQIYEIRRAAHNIFPLRLSDTEAEPTDDRGRPRSRGEAYRRMAIALGWKQKPSTEAAADHVLRWPETSEPLERAA